MRLLFTLFLASLFWSAQAQDTLRTIKAHPKLGYYQLDQEQRASWDAIKEDWREKYYWDCAKKFKKKVGCGYDCEGIWMEVTLHINKNGHLTRYDRDRIRTCDKKGETAIEDYLMEYFQQIIFPENLRSLQLNIRLGSALKC